MYNLKTKAYQGGRFFLACIGLLIISSCVFRPNYTRPPVNIPENWRLPMHEACSLANIYWWQQLGDPVLEALIREALKNNYTLQAAMASVEAYHSQFRATNSQLFPQITGDGSALRQGLSAQSNLGLAQNLRLINSFSALLSCAYELDIWGRLGSASDVALAQYLGEIQARRTVILTLVSALANSYITLRQYDEQLQIAQQTLNSFQESLQLMTDQWEEGESSELPIMQASAERDTAASLVKQLEINVAQQENLLCILLGRNPGNIRRGKILEELAQPPSIPAGLPSDVLEQRPDVMQAELNLIAAHANVGVAKANLFPRISLTGYYGNQSFALNTLFKGAACAWQVGTTFSEQIFNGGLYIAQLDQAHAQEKQALFSYYNTIQTAFKEVENALIGHSKSLEVLEIQKDQVQALQKSLALALLAYDNGQVDYLNVLDARRNLLSAQLNLVQARSATYTTFIGVYKALGGGWVQEADTLATEG
ncbi:MULTISPECIES: efflux transporter outer membrane subunit [unclassified Neochlamydia]|uniref:efflux transporter outer membrane subunit n=1 Tax=unclassified Neochlamydia TaxID=2643326 RepID=UPI001408F3FB|nr:MULTISPECIES: efflux transporter outer membrane subunit [unclassified Neochlamydia]MBS4169539.1 Outer membrane protein OprM [Neochlamydia sp. AcF95]NGY94554.1 Outer membrane protein OprM [Neochlamydia sp. AcF84]